VRRYGLLLLAAVILSESLASEIPNKTIPQRDVYETRNIFSPSAQTCPKGKITLFSDEIILTGVDYGLTESATISLETSLYKPDSFLMLSGKYKFVDLSHLRVAAYSSVVNIVISDLAVNAGLICDYRVLDNLAFSASLIGGPYVSYWKNYVCDKRPERTKVESFIYGGPAMRFGIMRNLDLVAENLILSTFGQSASDDRLEMLLSCGARFSSERFGIALYGVTPFTTEGAVCLNGVPLILPYLSAGYRF